jgi:hypothetical protein
MRVLTNLKDTVATDALIGAYKSADIHILAHYNANPNPNPTLPKRYPYPYPFPRP